MSRRSWIMASAVGFCLLCAPAFSFAADTAAPKEAKPAPQAASNQDSLVLMPSENIIITFPLVIVERGIVESVDTAKSTIVVKRKDGGDATIKVTPNTLIENVYMDIFHFDEKTGLKDIKKGDKVRVRAIPMDNNTQNALLVDVYRW